MILVAASSAIVWYRTADLGAFKGITIEPLMTDGDIPLAAMSPDGRFLAYDRVEFGKHAVWLRHMASGSSTQISERSEEQIMDLSFVRDSNSILATNQDESAYQIPLLGGPVRNLKGTWRVGAISISPDGRQRVFTRDHANGQIDLIISNIDGTGERTLSVRRDPEYFQAGPAWSPDGKLIACASGSLLPQATKFVLVLSTDGKRQWILSPKRFYAVLKAVWLPNGRGLAALVRDEPEGVSLAPVQVWYFPYPRGEARRLTHDLEDYDSLSVTADGTIAAIRKESAGNMWVVPVNRPDQARQITFGDLNWSRGQIGFTSDNRVLYAARTSRLQNLWTSKPDGSEAKQITTAGGWWPHLCSNVPLVVYEASMPPAPSNIWRAALDGSDPKQLSTLPGLTPFCSPDGKWVFFVQFKIHRTIVKVPITGGQAIEVTHEMTDSPSLSPDGTMMTATCWRGSRPAVGSVDGGPPKKVLLPDGYSAYCGTRWTQDGRSILYVAARNGAANVWSQPIDGGLETQWTHFTAGEIWGFALSPDEQLLALSRVRVNRSVVLIRDRK
jgi:Tol biopolymer transport system component